MNHKLTETQIETMLNTIQPEPGTGLHRRMAKAPWNAAPVYRMKPLQKLAMAAAGLLLLMAAMVYTPLGTLAQELLNFFTRAPGETYTHTYTAPAEPTPVSAALTTWQPLSLNAAQQQVNFTVRQPAFIPSGYQFDGADVYQNVVSLFYRIPGDTIGRNLVIEQALSSDRVSTVVGSNAPIELVQIGNVSGEYTHGWWEAAGDSSVVGREGELETRSVEMTWDSSVGFHFLRWEKDGIAYEIMFQESGNVTKVEDTSGEPGYLTLADLVAVAESLR